MLRKKKIAAIAAAAVMTVSAMAASVGAASDSKKGYSEQIGIFEGITSINIQGNSKVAVSSTTAYNSVPATITATLYMVGSNGAVLLPYSPKTLANTQYVSVGAGTGNTALMATAYGTHTVTAASGQSWTVQTQVYG